MKLLHFLSLMGLGLVSSQTPTASPTIDVGLVPLNISHVPANFTYQPSGIVLAFHNLPHFTNPKPGIVGVNSKPVFTANPSDPNTRTYLMQLVGFPILLFFIGLIALVCFQLGIFGYMHWLVPKMGPVPLDASEDTTAAIALWTHKVESSRKMWVIYFFVAVLITLLGNHMMFYGNSLFVKGYEIFKSSLANIHSKISIIGTNSEQISTAFGNVQKSINASAVSCPQASSPQMTVLIENEYAALNAMSFQTELVAEGIEGAQMYLVKIFRKYNSFLYTYYAITTALMICFVACFFTKQSIFMKVSIGIAQVVMLVLLVLCTAELIFMMGVGDFCMDPTTSVVNMIQNEDLADTAKYFGQCDPHFSGGKDPGTANNKLRIQLALAYEARTELGRALQFLYAPSEYLNPTIHRVGPPLCA